MSEIDITNKNFENEVLNSDKPVLVDFFATWCGPCTMLAPIVSEIAENYEDKIKVCKVNVDNEQALATKFQVASIPTLLLFKNGKIVNTSVGFHSKEDIENMILN